LSKTTNKLTSELLGGDRRALAQSITLIESTLATDRAEAEKLLAALMPSTGKSLRLGISGPPGVGKSTFIEAFGLLLIKQGHKVAVLAVDPSSPVSGGSILGDKTRMENLNKDPQSFIRPSPSSGNLGGVARHTRESIFLCEAAGYDFIIVETVGVGQSEIAVAGMTDVFLMLQLPNAGDELQGIKKGILELADLIAITKADGDMKNHAELARDEHRNALHYVRSNPPEIFTCSALHQLGLDEINLAIQKFADTQKKSGSFEKRRHAQSNDWFEAELLQGLQQHLQENAALQKLLKEAKADVSSGKMPASLAAQKVIAKLF